MATDINQIPVDIFEWQHRYPFSRLSMLQQEEVLRHFTQVEYDDMHQAILLVQETTQTRPDRKLAIKQQLLNRFDEVHHKPKQQVWTLPLQLWQAAAMVLLLGGAYLLLNKNKTIAPVQVIAEADTVYVEREVAPVKVYDTVYIERSTGKVKQVSRRLERSKNLREEERYPTQHDLQIHTIKDLNALPNQIKGNSIKDDSLISNYRFVTL